MSQVTVWHDGNCPLCRREIALMRRLDTRGAITFVDATGPAACPLDRGAMLARLHAREADGPLLSGAAAFAVMWWTIPLLRPLGEAARSPLILSMLERLYCRFLPLRPRLQRWLVRPRRRRAAASRPR